MVYAPTSGSQRRKQEVWLEKQVGRPQTHAGDAGTVLAWPRALESLNFPGKRKNFLLTLRTEQNKLTISDWFQTSRSLRNLKRMWQ